MKRIFVLIIAASIILIAGCGSQTDQGGAKMKLLSLFGSGDMLPSEYTCDGEGVSPPLMISNVPKNAKSLAIIIDDPDAPAGTFVHLAAWNISVSSTNIPKGNVPGNIGMNDFGKKGYGAPCPPSGVHHYRFKVFALDNLLNLPSNTDGRALEKAMKGHIAGQAEIIGLYSRS